MLPPFTYRFYELRDQARHSSDIERFDRQGQVSTEASIHEKTHCVGRRFELPASREISKAGATIPSFASCDYSKPGRGSGTLYPRSSADKHRFSGGSCYSGPHTTVAEGDRAPACTLVMKSPPRNSSFATRWHCPCSLKQRTPTMERQLARTHWLLLAASVETMVRSSTSARCI